MFFKYKELKNEINELREKNKNLNSQLSRIDSRCQLNQKYIDIFRENITYLQRIDDYLYKRIIDDLKIEDITTDIQMNLSHKNIIVFAGNRSRLEELNEVMSKKFKSYPHVAKMSISSSGGQIRFEDDSIVKWMIPSDSSRGHRADLVYVDYFIPDTIANELCIPSARVSGGRYYYFH